jgi:hypothetical protein
MQGYLPFYLAFPSNAGLRGGSISLASSRTAWEGYPKGVLLWLQNTSRIIWPHRGGLSHIREPLYRGLWFLSHDSRKPNFWVFYHRREASNILGSSGQRFTERENEGGLLMGMSTLTIKRNWNDSQKSRPRRRIRLSSRLLRTRLKIDLSPAGTSVRAPLSSVNDRGRLEIHHHQ